MSTSNPWGEVSCSFTVGREPSRNHSPWSGLCPLSYLFLIHSLQQKNAWLSLAGFGAQAHPGLTSLKHKDWEWEGNDFSQT